MDIRRVNQKWVVRGLLFVVLAVMAWQAGVAMLYEPLQEDHRKIARYEKTLKALHHKKNVEAPAAVKRWRALAALTLSKDSTEVKNALTQDLTRLAVASKLTKPAIRPKRPLQSRKSKGIVRIPVSVVAQGTLDKVVRFLSRVYELPYLVRVREVRLSPTGGKGSKLVSLSLGIESLVLPETRKNRAFVRDVETFELDASAKERPSRDPPVLEHPIAAYVAMADRHPFHGFRPAPKKPVRATRPPVRAHTRLTSNSRKRRTTKRPSPSRDPRGYTKVTSSLSFQGGQEVALTNTQSKTRVVLRVGDELKVVDDKGKAFPEGRIILVHPYGFVTQQGNERRFFALDTLLNQAEVVDENTDPAIRAALAALDSRQGE